MSTIDARLASLRLIAFDIDGVLTDGRLYYGPDGAEFKAFHTRDGHGIKQLIAAGLHVAVITGRSSEAVATRMAELGVQHVVQGCRDKVAALTVLLGELNVGVEFSAFMGDDTVDLPVMRAAGLAITVADAHPLVLRAADMVTDLTGGRGAVREVCDRLLLARAQASQA